MREPEYLPVKECLEERAIVKKEGAALDIKDVKGFFMILIIGGVRSGKSKFALELAKKSCAKAAYIATAPACDKEMKRRIRLHRKKRPKNWLTIEAQKDLFPSLKKIPKTCDGLIIECVGTYISNLMHGGYSDAKIMKDAEKTIRFLKGLNKKIYIVSNEVGSGVVPNSEIGRRFRDIVGSVNQMLARSADEVYLVTAGLPIKLK